MQKNIFSAKMRGMSYTSWRIQSPLNAAVIRRGQTRLELSMTRVYAGKEFLAQTKNSDFCLMNEQDRRVILSIFLCVVFPLI